jgi:hypothetical protein
VRRSERFVRVNVDVKSEEGVSSEFEASFRSEKGNEARIESTRSAVVVSLAGAGTFTSDKELPAAVESSKVLAVMLAGTFLLSPSSKSPSSS